MDADSWREKTWGAAKLMVGSTATPYDLRHTAASLWIASGLNHREVAQLLGHSTPALTLDTYGHLFEEAQLVDGESVEDAALRARAAAAATLHDIIARNIVAAEQRLEAALAAVDAARNAAELAAARKERRSAKYQLRTLRAHPAAGG
jgi:hypothetical protein